MEEKESDSVSNETTGNSEQENSEYQQVEQPKEKQRFVLQLGWFPWELKDWKKTVEWNNQEIEIEIRQSNTFDFSFQKEPQEE